MNDDKQLGANRVEPPPRTPNRGDRRRPPVIEGEAKPVRAADEPAPGPEPVAPAPVDPLPSETAAASAPPDAAPPVVPPGEPAEPDVTLPPPAEAPVPPPDRRGYGLGAVAGASLASAAIAALAVFGLQSATAPSGPAPAALEARIADMEKRAAAPSVTPAAIAALEKRVASVETLASGASEAARKAAEAAARAPAPSGAAQTPGASQQALDALGGRIAALEKNASGASSALDARLAAVEKSLAAPKTEDRAAETRVEPAPPPDLDPLRKDLAALEARLDALEKSAAPIADAGRAMQGAIKDLEAKIQPLAGRIDESRAQSEAERKRAEALAERSAGAARMTLAQSVSAAIASGAPFAAQVEALTRMGVPAERLAPLQAAAKTGVATNEELARGLAGLEPKIVARAEPGADGSVIDRLTNSALGLVRVRPSGQPTGDAPADVFARMSHATRAGDLAAALKEWEKLPEGAKAASADWANRARARVAAEAAARAILSDQAQTIGRS